MLSASICGVLKHAVAWRFSSNCSKSSFPGRYMARKKQFRGLRAIEHQDKPDESRRGYLLEANYLEEVKRYHDLLEYWDEKGMPDMSDLPTDEKGEPILPDWFKLESVQDDQSSTQGVTPGAPLSAKPISPMSIRDPNLLRAGQVLLGDFGWPHLRRAGTNEWFHVPTDELAASGLDMDSFAHEKGADAISSSTPGEHPALILRVCRELEGIFLNVVPGTPRIPKDADLSICTKLPSPTYWNTIQITTLVPMVCARNRDDWVVALGVVDEEVWHKVANEIYQRVRKGIPGL